MQPVLISIMMPAYNAEDYIGDAIDSVLAQSYSNWELIIVNDGSIDRTAEIAAKYTDLRIKVFHQANGGESVARNTALEQVNGEYVAFLDADDLFLPSHLETTVGFLQGHPQYDGVYTDGYYINEKGDRLKLLSSRRRGPFSGDIFEEMVRASDVFGAPVCVVLRHNIIVQHGLNFDPEIVIGPDWDFLTQYSAVAQFGYVTQPTCLYRVHQTNISVRTNAQKRALHLARCREKAIKMARFNDCSEDTRTYVFYDLLINCMTGFPEQQTAIMDWPEFAALPGHERARLYRLMASKALLRSVESKYVQEWLSLANGLNPLDRRGKLLSSIYQLNPNLCKFLLGLKASTQTDTSITHPFGDLH
jgi:glycosyltransferase involved in cell wall biosynthesis